MKKYKCSVCGYVHTGDEAPGKCPICGAAGSAFSEAAAGEGKSLQEYVDAQINGEAWEVVHYIGAAMLAESLGHPEVGRVLRGIASEEADHGANYVHRSGALGTDVEALKDFIKKMAAAEMGAHKMKAEGSALALAEGKNELAGLFKTSSEDEKRHSQMWEWCLKQL
ncbi:MAG: hypothetical protein HQK84_01340 [Nitrospinae bacterium]|nr:hypothetical protein [Nitrospinota bacterium]